MKIDKADLNRNFWYEDCDGNIIDIPEDYCGNDDDRVVNAEHATYHSLFPLEITEHIYEYAFHPQTKIQKVLYKIKPIRKYMLRKHKQEKTFRHVCDFNSHIGSGNQDVIMAMVNSGDYTLSEALMLWSQSCERCMNVLAYNYGCDDGYAEYSDKWKKCNTRCKFCEDELIKEQKNECLDRR